MGLASFTKGLMLSLFVVILRFNLIQKINLVNKNKNKFRKTKNQLEYPDFLDIQLKSFQDFFQLETNPEKRKNEGLFKVFAENFPNY
jgi:DNA-directed RNA polymerase beta subunit